MATSIIKRSGKKEQYQGYKIEEAIRKAFHSSGTAYNRSIYEEVEAKLSHQDSAHGNKYGVKMKAEAPSINLIKAHIETEIAPIVGSEQQAQDLIAYIKENARDSDDGIWNTNIFGKSIEQIVEDGIQAKVSQMTEDCQLKLQDTLQKIINDSNGGMICIII